MWNRRNKTGGKENRYVESGNITRETEKNKKICQLFSELTFDTGNGIGNWHVCRRKQSQSEGRNSICRIPGSFRKQHSRGTGIQRDLCIRLWRCSRGRSCRAGEAGKDRGTAGDLAVGSDPEIWACCILPGTEKRKQKHHRGAYDRLVLTGALLPASGRRPDRGRQLLRIVYRIFWWKPVQWVL